MTDTNQNDPSKKEDDQTNAEPSVGNSKQLNEQVDVKDKRLKKEVSVSFLSFLRNIGKLLVDILDIREGANPEKTREAIIHDIEFKGANVWSLIASIFIASIGLNMNSTAVVIGAMLISPLMGPIIGIGYSIAINDLTLFIKALKNFGVMVVLSIFTSTLYFWLSPLNSASAEIIGRTQPTLLDLFVAIFGGIAGIVSISKSERTNVIPGVAIATALIPPLCTAGYGIAEANLSYFIGASYLFLINSVFIAMASFVIIRYLRFPFREHVDPKREKKVKRVMVIFSILVMIPSAYMFFGAIQKFNFESQSSVFIDEIVDAPESKILKTDIVFKKDTVNYIDLYMIGDPIKDYTIDLWNSKLIDYRLENTILRVFQDKDIEQQYIAMDDLEKNVKSGIIEELYQKNQQALFNKDEKIMLLEGELAKYKSNGIPLVKIDNEVRSLEPYISKLSIGENYFRNDSNQVDTIYSMLITYDKKILKDKKAKADIAKKLGNWLKVRLDKDSVLVIDVN
jgi:uncharacterized hydrophobic protein (TIGR00271 family)